MSGTSEAIPETEGGKDAATDEETVASQSAEATPAAPESAAAEGGEPTLPSDIVGTQDEPDLAHEVADLKDQLLRSLAEVDNIRKRAQREREDASKFAVSSFAKDLLGVADNLQRALESLPRDLADSDDRIKALVDGVGMTERELVNVFERHGLTKISPLGEKFDHDYHQALFEVPDSDAEPGIVVQVVATGYLLNGRLLRPAMVGVAKSGGKDGTTPDTPQIDTSV